MDNVSISNNFPTDKRKIKTRLRNSRVTSEQWPRMYGRGIESIKAKRWELRNYTPKVV